MANYDFNVDGFFYEILDGTKNVAVVREKYFSQRPYSGEIRIPETVIFDGETYKVTEIGQQLFSHCTEITKVFIPAGVTSIHTVAFSGCTGLTDVYISDGLAEIADFAFYDCTGLRNFHVSDANAVYCDIDGVLFSKDKTKLVLYPQNGKVPGYKIPESVRTIGEYAFGHCIGLTDVDIPDSVTEIERSAFYGCRGLTEMSIPDSVTQIGGNIFCQCRRLRSIHVAENNPAYCDIDGVLYSKDREKLIEFPSAYATEYNIPEGVRSIGAFAFCDCNSLTNVNIPDSVTEIGFSAFDRCFGLTEVDIPDSVTKIESQAFMQCHGLSEIIIPEGVTEIGHMAFCDCDNLRNVVIGVNVRTIREHAFYDCRRLHSIICVAQKPPRLEREVFPREIDVRRRHDEHITLAVPFGSVDAYRSDREWGMFEDISGL